MDLADLPNLIELKLLDTAVTGDIRDIGENDFLSLEYLSLPKGVYGGFGYELGRVSDALDLIRAVYLLKKQRPALIDIDSWSGRLSQDSPEWYESENAYAYAYVFPFYIGFVQAGSRVGYRWESTAGSNPCEVNWLDPEPDRESSGYDEYIEMLQSINSEVDSYKGFYHLPPEEEYRRLMEWESGSES